MKKREGTDVTVSEKQTREPLIRVTKRSDISRVKAMLLRVIAVAAALLLCSLLSMILIGADPIKFIMTMIEGVFGSTRRMLKFFKDSAVLLCIALAITPAFRMRFWNIGAEGQVLIGALASVAVVIYLGGSLPNWLLLILMLLASIVAGAIFGGFPAIFKAKWGTNETLFTLMMNYIATQLVAYFLMIWTPSGSSVLGELNFGHLPILGHEYLLLILIVLLLTVIAYIYLNYTKQGYEISVVGESENTARYVGIRVGKVIVRTMIISGAVCGLAGFLIVGALDHSITTLTVGGLGFTAIMVSWLAKFNPLVMVGTAAFITFLTQGADRISTIFNVASAYPDMVVGIVLFFVIGCEFFISYTLKFRKTHKKGGNAE